MRIEPEHADRLKQLFRRPGLSLRSRLILARRLARYACTERSLSRGHANSEIREAEAGLPLTKGQLAKIRQSQKEAHRTTLVDIGTWLCQHEEALTEQYGFEGICDVLEVNPVHRAEVIEGAKDMRRSISAIAFIAALEDSANVKSGQHPAECKDGPLYQALREKMKEVHSGH